MPMVEVDEEELHRNYKLRQTVQSLWAHPQAKLKIQEATKMVFPQAITPELDSVKHATDRDSVLVNKIGELEKKIVDDHTRREDEARLRALNEKFEGGFRKLRDAGWTDAGVEAVRKIMEDKGILDHEVAAAFYEKQNPPQSPVTPSGRGGWNFLDQVTSEEGDLKKMIETKGQHEGIVDKIAHDALNEIRNQRR